MRWKAGKSVAIQVKVFIKSSYLEEKLLLLQLSPCRLVATITLNPSIAYSNQNRQNPHNNLYSVRTLSQPQQQPNKPQKTNKHQKQHHIKPPK